MRRMPGDLAMLDCADGLVGHDRFRFPARIEGEQEQKEFAVVLPGHGIFGYSHHCYLLVIQSAALQNWILYVVSGESGEHYSDWAGGSARLPGP